MNKPFDPQLFGANDPQSRSVVAEFYKSRGCLVRANPDQYGIDLFVTRKVEIERRPNWYGNRFPFETVHIPARKEKFFNEGCLYVVVNGGYDAMLTIDGSVILKHPRVRVPNKFMDDEFFYDVPSCKFKLWHLTE